MQSPQFSSKGEWTENRTVSIFPPINAGPFNQEGFMLGISFGDLRGWTTSVPPPSASVPPTHPAPGESGKKTAPGYCRPIHSVLTRRLRRTDPLQVIKSIPLCSPIFPFSGWLPKIWLWLFQHIQAQATTCLQLPSLILSFKLHRYVYAHINLLNCSQYGPSRLLHSFVLFF